MIERSLRVSEFQSAKMYHSLLDKQIHLIEKKIEQLRAKKEKQIELIEKKKNESLRYLRRISLKVTIDERRQELKDLNDKQSEIIAGCKVKEKLFISFRFYWLLLLLVRIINFSELYL